MAACCSPPPTKRRRRPRVGWLPAAVAAAAAAAAAKSAAIAAAAALPTRRGAWVPTFSGGSAQQVAAVRYALRLLGRNTLPVPEDVHLLVTFKPLEGEALAHTRGASFWELLVPAVDDAPAAAASASTQTDDPPRDADDAADGGASPSGSLVRFPAIAAAVVRATHPEAQVQPTGGGALPNPPPPLLVGAQAGRYDMRVDINSRIDWYTGTDERPPADTWDLVTVTLHEALHGALFSGGIRYMSASGSTPARALFRLGSAPTRFDTFLSTPTGCAVAAYAAAGDTAGEEDLAAALTNGALYFTSDGTRLRLHAPATYSVESSVYHLAQPRSDSAGRGGRPSLMQPRLMPGVAIHTPDSGTQAVIDAVLSLSAPPAKTCAVLPSPAEVAAAAAAAGDTAGGGTDGSDGSSGVPVDGGADDDGGGTIFGLSVAAFTGIASAAGVLIIAIVTTFVVLCGRERPPPGAAGCTGTGAAKKVGGDHGGGAEARSRRRRAAREAAAAGRGNPLRPPRAHGGDGRSRDSAAQSGVDSGGLAAALAAWSAGANDGGGRRADSGGSSTTAVTDSTRTSSGGSVDGGGSAVWGVVSAPPPAYLVGGRGRAVISRVNSALEWASDGGSDEEGEGGGPTRPPG